MSMGTQCRALQGVYPSTSVKNKNESITRGGIGMVMYQMNFLLTNIVNEKKKHLYEG